MSTSRENPVEEKPLEQKPETEVLLSKLEAEYLVSRDNLTYQKIFSAIFPYARSLVLKKTRGKAFLPPDLVDEAALESTIKFMSQYEKPEYKTKASFAGLLTYKVLESLYGPKVRAVDDILSLNEHIEKDQGHETELGDLSENYNFTYLFRAHSHDITDDPSEYLFDTSNDAINNMMSVVKDIYTSVDLHSFFIISNALFQFIEKSKTLDKFKDRFMTPPMKEIYDISLLEMMNRLQGIA